MKKQEKVYFILNTLQTLFPAPPIPLLHTDPYTLLIAVLLSAHSTDASVNKVTPLLFSKAKTPNEMIKLSVEEIQRIVRPCGLSLRKATAIWELSHLLLEKYEGRVPEALEALVELPGVGHKTASVVLCQAFGKSAFPVDTHIDRCARRWGLTKGKTRTQTERDLKRVIPEELWGLVHLQIIHYARKYCPARAHKVENCPICSFLEKEKS